MSQGTTLQSPPSAEAQARNRFRHHTIPVQRREFTSELPVPPIQSPPEEMSLFKIGQRVLLRADGFEGLNYWPGTITKRVDTFSGLDCKLTIRFDDARYRRTFSYKFSKHRESLQILDENSEVSSRPPPLDSASQRPGCSAPLAAEEPVPTPLTTPNAQSSQRPRRSTVPLNYKE